MSYLAYAFGAAIAFALSGLIYKFASKHTIDNKDSMMAYFMLSLFGFSLILSPFVGWALPPMSALLPLFSAVIFFLFGYFCFYIGIFDTDASSFAPLFQLQAGLIAVLAFLFLGERFPLANYLWMVFLIFGALLVSLDEKMSLKSFLKPGIVFILLMQLLHATSNLLIGVTLRHTDFLSTIFWQGIIIGVFFVIFYFVKRPKMSYPRAAVIPVVAASLVASVGAIGLFKAFEVNLTMTSAIALLNAPLVFVVSVFASRFYPNLLEHHPAKVYVVRGVGLVIIVLAAVKITLG